MLFVSTLLVVCTSSICKSTSAKNVCVCICTLLLAIWMLYAYKARLIDKDLITIHHVVKHMHLCSLDYSFYSIISLSHNISSIGIVHPPKYCWMSVLIMYIQVKYIFKLKEWYRHDRYKAEQEIDYIDHIINSVCSQK